jgi:hypothetical protein
LFLKDNFNEILRKILKEFKKKSSFKEWIAYGHPQRVNGSKKIYASALCAWSIFVSALRPTFGCHALLKEGIA